MIIKSHRLAVKAIESLDSNAKYSIKGNEITWFSSPIDEQKIKIKIDELESLEPMRVLREERNRRIAETDWWAVKEVDGWQMSPQQRVYRKDLRDMPQTSPYPMLNENGELTIVDFQEKP